MNSASPSAWTLPLSSVSRDLMKILRRSICLNPRFDAPGKPERRQVQVIDGDARPDHGMTVHPADRTHGFVEDGRDRSAMDRFGRSFGAGPNQTVACR